MNEMVVAACARNCRLHSTPIHHEANDTHEDCFFFLVVIHVSINVSSTIVIYLFISYGRYHHLMMMTSLEVVDGLFDDALLGCK